MSENINAPSLLSVVGLASTLSLSASVLVFVFTAWGWETVIWAATRYALFAMAPMAIAIGLWANSFKHGLVTAFIAAFFGAPLYVWTLPEVRTEAVKVAGPYLPGMTLISALDDEVNAVADEACVALMGRGYNAVRFQIPDIMRRPEVIAECLSRDFEGTDAPALIRREVAAQWETKILSANTANACDLLPGYLKIVEKDADVAARLLNFATGAAHEAVRQCALEEFAKAYSSPLKQLKALGNPDKVDANITMPLFRGMTSATYGPHTKGLHKQILDTPLMKQWGLSLGCRIVVDANHAAEAAPMLNTAASLQGCGKADGVDALSVWANACADALEGNSEGLVTTSMVCERIHTHAMETALGSASTVVHAAVESLTQQELERQIAIGERQRKLSDRLNTFAGFDAHEEALDDLPPAMAADMRRQLSGVRRGGGQVYPDFNGAMKGGINKGMAELFIQMGDSGAINGIDIRKEIARSGADPDEVFNKERMAEVRKALNSKTLDQSGVNDEGADAGMYDPDVSGPTMEEFLGREQASEE